MTDETRGPGYYAAMKRLVEERAAQTEADARSRSKGLELVRCECDIGDRCPQSRRGFTEACWTWQKRGQR